MKKLTIAVGLLLGGITANAQTEYVELSSSKLFKKSFIAFYNDDVSYNDLEVLTIRGNKVVEDHIEWLLHRVAPDTVEGMIDQLNLIVTWIPKDN